MKYKVITLSMVISIMGMSVVEAGGRHRQYNNHYRSHNYYKHDYGHRHGGYKKHYRRHDSYYDDYSYGHRGHYKSKNHGYNAAYALGGLIVGGVIGATIANSYHSDNYSSYSSSRYREPVQVNTFQGYANKTGSSFVLQPDGSCFAVDHVSNGKLVLSPVLTRNCQ